jgi:hypothetical protein
VVQLDQILGNRQPQAHSAELPRYVGVALLEGVCEFPKFDVAMPCRRNLTFLLPLFIGIWCQLISGLDRSAAACISFNVGETPP